MHLLLIIFIFILAVILIIFTAFRKIVSFLLGGLLGKKSTSGQYYRGSSEQNRTQNHNSYNENSESQKVFSRDEGEYISFEEVD